MRESRILRLIKYHATIVPGLSTLSGFDCVPARRDNDASRSAISRVAENGAVRHGASMPAIRPFTRKVDRLSIESQVPRLRVDRGKPHLAVERAITRDDQAIPARFERKPMWVFARRQQDAADFVRMFRIAHIQAHDRVSALRGFHQKTAYDHRHFARAVTQVINMLERWIVAGEIAHHEQTAIERRHQDALAVRQYARFR